MRKIDEFRYINNYYGLNIRRGTNITYNGRGGKVTGTSNAHVMIKLDGDKNAKPYHPRTDGLEYPDSR